MRYSNQHSSLALIDTISRTTRLPSRKSDLKQISMEKMPRLVPPSLQAFTSFPFHWKKASPCPLLRKKITKTYLQVHKPPSKPCDSQAPNNIRWWSFSWPQVFYDFFSDEYRDGGRDGLLHMSFPLSLIQI